MKAHSAEGNILDVTEIPSLPGVVLYSMDTVHASGSRTTIVDEERRRNRPSLGAIEASSVGEHIEQQTTSAWANLLRDINGWAECQAFVAKEGIHSLSECLYGLEHLRKTNLSRVDEE